MRGFARRDSVATAIAWVDEHARCLDAIDVPLAESYLRVLATNITSPVDVPGFDRAMMDGFAVRAGDTQSASPYNRLPLELIGKVLPGDSFDNMVEPEQAVAIMTGAVLPSGADAVLPAEQSQKEGDNLLAIGEVSPGKHVGQRGEDIQAGDVVLARGRRLRPQDCGVLSSIGTSTVSVVRQPIVRIVITGNELLPPGEKPQGKKITDANGPMLEALVRRDGGQPLTSEIVRDQKDDLRKALHSDADIILVSGGSSVGEEDFAPVILAEDGELAIHGIAMRPSSPTGMGRLDNRLVFLLPGNPVSCLCAYDFFAGRAIRAMAGRARDWPYRRVTMQLARKISSVVGRMDYARVKVTSGKAQPLAISGASILTSTTRADGFVLIEADSEGFADGAEVAVFLYDPI